MFAPAVGPSRAEAWGVAAEGLVEDLVEGLVEGVADGDGVGRAEPPRARGFAPHWLAGQEP